VDDFTEVDPLIVTFEGMSASILVVAYFRTIVNFTVGSGADKTRQWPVSKGKV
jgi:hypothetical protein